MAGRKRYVKAETRPLHLYLSMMALVKWSYKLLLINKCHNTILSLKTELMAAFNSSERLSNQLEANSSFNYK